MTAGGPEIPETLRRQLKIGGRLVIPIGTLATRAAAGQGGARWRERVPRGGSGRRACSCRSSATHGWSDRAGEGGACRPKPAPAVRPRAPADLLRAAAEPLPDLDDPAFGRLFDRFADARVVLLGEATHGTSEFYRARAAITRRLIEQPWLHHCRGRGGLAGRGGDRPLCPSQGAERRGRAGVPPLPDLDVAQRRGARFRRLAARAQRSASIRRAVPASSGSTSTT